MFIMNEKIMNLNREIEIKKKKNESFRIEKI